MQKAKVALESHGSYISSCNLYWLDMWKNPAPGVPLARERIAALANFYYPEDRNNNFFHKLLEVQVDVPSRTSRMVWSSSPHWRSSTPLSSRPRRNLVAMVSRPIAKIPGDKHCSSAYSPAVCFISLSFVTVVDRRFHGSKTVRTAVPVVMTACSESDVWLHALNKRQMVAQEHESLSRTAWQTAAELYHLQADLSLLS